MCLWKYLKEYGFKIEKKKMSVPNLRVRIHFQQILNENQAGNIRSKIELTEQTDLSAIWAWPNILMRLPACYTTQTEQNKIVQTGVSLWFKLAN